MFFAVAAPGNGETAFRHNCSTAAGPASAPPATR